MPLKSSFFYLSALLLFLASCVQQDKKQAAEYSENIPVATMADAGIDSIAINKVDTVIRNGTYPNIHSLLIARKGRLVYERYWPGKDESWDEISALSFMEGIAFMTSGASPKALYPPVLA